MPVAVDTEAPDVDSLLVDAQDAFFEGRLADTIALTSRVLELAPTEAEAYSLLFVALFQLERFEDVVQHCEAWEKCCGPCGTQLEGGLTAAYMLDRRDDVAAWADRVVAMSDSALEQATAAALAADAGHPAPFECAWDDVDAGSLDHRVQCLMAWVMAKAGQTPQATDRLTVLSKCAAGPRDNPQLAKANLAFAHALLALAHAECEEHEAAVRVLRDCEALGCAQDANVAAARWLIEHNGNGEPKPPSHVHANPLLRKRVRAA